MTYVDGFVIAIPRKNVAAYKKMALLGKKAWMRHGALDYYECVADDLRVKRGMGVSFTKLAKLRPGETVLFSFIVFKSRRHRDQVNKKVMADFATQDMAKMEMPFKMDRFSYGGFKTIVQA